MSTIQSTTPSSTAGTSSTVSGANTTGTTPLITSSVGPVSGINYQNLITALEASQSEQVTDLQNDISAIQAQQTGYQTLEANLAPVTTAIQSLALPSTFQNFQVQLSDPTQMNVTAGTNAAPGSYQFQSLQLASTQTDLSQGFVNDSSQTVGTGTLTISSGGGLAPPTLLSALNGNTGVQAGSIRITDAAGHTTTVNLSNAYSVNDVINAINNNGVAEVAASTSGGHLVITDESGGTGTLSIGNVSGDQTATDLGIAQSSSTGAITGQDVYQTTTGTLLSQINDGNGLYTATGAPSLAITLSDGTELQVNLDNAETVGDVLNDINNATGNGGKLVAALANGGIQLTDNSGGTGTLTVSNENQASVVNELGLNVAADGNTISGTSLLAGINSVLLSNLNGGQGITQTGEIELQDRTGLTATINLTGVQSLDQVINAINSATTTGGQKLNLTASIDPSGDGIEVTDTSGSTADNLQIQDVGSGTLASQLGISVNAATSSVDSGRLNLQYVNESTSLSTYAPGGTAVPDGQFTITNSAGKSATIAVTSADTTLGDVMQQINSAGLNVTAQLNSTGDGIVLVDNAGGSGALTVKDNDGGTTATDLRIAGTGTANGNGQSQIDGRTATVINVTSTDTLNSLVSKIGTSGIVSASIVNDGSADDPDHLALTSNTAGAAGQFFVDQSGVNLGFQTTTQAQNGLLRVGSGSSGFIQTSSNNQFNNALPGLTVQLLAVGQQPDTATVTQDDTAITTAVQNFVTNYNNFVSQASTLTAFNTTTESGGALEGSPTVTEGENQLTELITQPFSSGSTAISTLVDLGITVGSNGQLSLDQSTLQNALNTNPSAVASFFTTAKTGFAAVAQNTLNAITDPNTGSFTEASNSLQDSITNYQNRITELNQILSDQETNLTNIFANLETNLAQMQLQQQYVALIAQDSPSNSSSSSSSSSSNSSSKSSIP
jgi:flagellar hook-associated protein 2